MKVLKFDVHELRQQVKINSLKFVINILVQEG